MSAVPTPECLWCAARGLEATRWRATGQTFLSRHGIRRAELVCEACGHEFSSAAPAALEAAAQVTPSLPQAPGSVHVPAPGLFDVTTAPRQSQGFVSVAELARRRIAAQKRQSRTTGGPR